MKFLSNLKMNLKIFIHSSKLFGENNKMISLKKINLFLGRGKLFYITDCTYFLISDKQD